MTDTPTALEFYWRPGCGFCMMLDRQLSKREIALAKKNIWDDTADAAFVRSVADGSETVPTVVVDGEALVNPSVGQVLDLLERRAPHLLPEGHDRNGTGPIGRVFDRLRGDS